jgi:hypothetical protein
MADALDLKSSGGQPPCGFDSRLGYFFRPNDLRRELTGRLSEQKNVTGDKLGTGLRCVDALLAAREENRVMASL